MTKLNFSTSDSYGDGERLFASIAESGAISGGVPRIHPIPWPLMWSYLQRSGTEDDGFDISEVGSTWVASFADMGRLSEIVPAQHPLLCDASRFVPSAWRSAGPTDAERRFAVPYLADTRIVYYWKDMLRAVDGDDPAAFGTPSRMDTTLAALKKIGMPAWAAPTFGVTNVVHEVASWIWGGGGDFLSEDRTRTAFCSDEAIAGIVSYFSLQRHMDYKHDSLDSVLESFERRQAAVIISGPWFYHRLLRQHSADTLSDILGTALPPGPPFVGGSSLVVWKRDNATREEKALKWVTLLTHPRAQEAVAKKTGLLPVIRECFDRPPYTVDPHYQVFHQALKAGRSLPQVAFWGALEEALVRVFGKVWNDLKDDTTTRPERAVQEHLIPTARAFDAKLREHPWTHES